jgi:hypothetical protein
MSPADVPPGRGRSALAVLLAAVFLAVIGASVGVAAGVTTRPKQDATSSRGTSAGPENSPDDASTPTSTGGSTGATGDECPRYTVDAATHAGAKPPLQVVLYVRTVDAQHLDSSQVWICRDAGGRLFYQGHSVQRGEMRAANSDNSLFLSAVVADGDGYTATNTDNSGTTTYHVSGTELIIRQPHDTWTERVVEHTP